MSRGKSCFGEKGSNSGYCISRDDGYGSRDGYRVSPNDGGDSRDYDGKTNRGGGGGGGDSGHTSSSSSSSSGAGHAVVLGSAPAVATPPSAACVAQIKVLNQTITQLTAQTQSLTKELKAEAANRALAEKMLGWVVQDEMMILLDAVATDNAAAARDAEKEIAQRALHTPMFN